MSVLQIVYGYKPIFRQKAEKVEVFDDSLKATVSDMLDTMYHEKAVGLGANMVGITKCIVVADLLINGTKDPVVLINPQIISESDEMQTYEEASLSFPGVVINISRPQHIHIKYQNLEGKHLEIKEEDFLSSVLQHEIDYLHGKTIFDHVSKMKKDILLKKMNKYMEMHPPHVHSSSCRH